MEKTSLEKSHSKWSNTKLTFICLFEAIFFAVFFVGMGIIGMQAVDTIIGILVAIIGVLGFALFAVLLKKFIR